MEDWFWRPASEKLTGNSRHRLGRRGELVLQVETEITERHMSGSKDRQSTAWRDARVQDLPTGSVG